MEIKSRLLECELVIKCKGKPVKYHNIKIGKIMGSEMKDGKLYVNIKIFKKFEKDIIKAIKKERDVSFFQIKV